MKLNTNTKFFQFAGDTADLIALNLVFLLTCIPVITIGPAIAAIYQVLMRESRGEHGYLIKPYFQYFKQMFFKACIAFLMFATGFLLLTFAFTFWWQMDVTYNIAVCVIIALIGCLLLSIFIYTFPLMARFEDTLGRILKNAFLLTFVHTKYTGILLIMHLTFLSMLAFFTGCRIFAVIIGFALFYYWCSYILTKLFKRYEHQDSASSMETVE